MMFLLVTSFTDTLQVTVVVRLLRLFGSVDVVHEAIKVVDFIGLADHSMGETHLAEGLVFELEGSQSSPPRGVVYLHTLFTLCVVSWCLTFKTAL